MIAVLALGGIVIGSVALVAALVVLAMVAATASPASETIAAIVAVFGMSLVVGACVGTLACAAGWLP